jgi:hypothetical protein
MKNKTIAVTGVALAAAAGIAMGGVALANADQPPAGTTAAAPPQ